jgi:tRNA (adenine57-N1/adenine58-N1)-methyltransferase
LGRENILCTNRDAYNDGFIVPGELEIGQADGVFLDLPSPWLAVPHVKTILKRGGRVCNFSPCIEQVQRTILEFSKVGFGNFVTIECIQRNYEKRMTKRNNIYSGLDNILKNEANLPESERSLTQEQVDEIKKNNYLPGNSREFHYEFGIGDGKWHTGYLTFGIKFKN